MKGPKQVLQAVTLWEEGVPLEQLPYFFDDEHPLPEKLPAVVAATPGSGCPGPMLRSQARACNPGNTG